MSDWVTVGVLNGAHGVKGEVRLRPFTADPKSVLAFETLYRGEGGEPLIIRASRKIKGGYAVTLDGVTTREQAAAMQRIDLMVPRTALPEATHEDEFYVTDLIGLGVLAPDGVRVGTVKAVEDFGGGDLLELGLDAPLKGFGKVVMLPFTRTLVPGVDIAAGTVTVDLARWTAEQVEVAPQNENSGEAEEEW